MSQGSPPASPSHALPGARIALVMLVSINLFNYIDRSVLSAVLPRIHETFLHNDEDAGKKLGLLTTAFLVAYMVLSPLFGWLGDRMSRWILIAVGVMLWSLASGASGLASGFWMLLATRCFVGVGEAAYAPTAPTLISDLFPMNVRGKVMAFFFAAIPVGSALGYVLGGLVETVTGQWEWAFYCVVPPGILLGACCLFLREPARGQADPGARVAGHSIGMREYLLLARNRSFVLDTLGMTAMTFALGGMGVWMPLYVYEREAKGQITDETVAKLRAKKIPEEVVGKLEQLPRGELLPINKFGDRAQSVLSKEEWKEFGGRVLNECSTKNLGEINTFFGLIVVVSGLIATLLGGWAGDALRPRIPGSYFLVSGLSMLIGFPMVLCVLWVPFPLAWGFVFLAVFFLFFNTGPTNTILANVTHPAIRSTAFAVNILVLHALGDVISPTVMGAIKDSYSMDLAMGLVSAVVLAGGGFWLWGTIYLERDTARAPTSLDVP
jgi:MFS transporter, Spinster family, sphingosine-1-phosphate transporter